ncbi:hypothetical protein AB1Y20_018801 [Prymnesium parvum]|uniref:Methyltransferase FkbM domain-containing protein n=1 Tax=Prymnesium parvum TaxID=97485 RepID=A0AB34JSF2_PRYPA
MLRRVGSLCMRAAGLRLWLLLAGGAQASLVLKDLPANAKRLLLNIGSNVNPILPPDDDEAVITVAFEPVVFSQITPHKRLYVVPAAVSNESGLTTMVAYNHGLSASLGAPAIRQAALETWRSDAPQTVVVPVVTMASVLAGIRGDLAIWFLKTDAQGLDFTILAAAGLALQRIQYVLVEVWLSGVYSYDGPSNDYCQDILPLMLARGFEPTSLSAASGAEMHLAHYTNRTKAEVAHNRFFFSGGGEEAAREYCERELRLMGGKIERRSGIREANAYFKFRKALISEPPLGMHKHFKSGDAPHKATSHRHR